MACSDNPPPCGCWECVECCEGVTQVSTDTCTFPCPDICNAFNLMNIGDSYFTGGSIDVETCLGWTDIISGGPFTLCGKTYSVINHGPVDLACGGTQYSIEIVRLT